MCKIVAGRGLSAPTCVGCALKVQAEVLGRNGLLIFEWVWPIKVSFENVYAPLFVVLEGLGHREVHIKQVCCISDIGLALGC